MKSIVYRVGFSTLRAATPVIRRAAVKANTLRALLLMRKKALSTWLNACGGKFWDQASCGGASNLTYPIPPTPRLVVKQLDPDGNPLTWSPDEELRVVLRGSLLLRRLGSLRSQRGDLRFQRVRQRDDDQRSEPLQRRRNRRSTGSGRRQMRRRSLR
jgi:hypothetical protein